MIRLVRLDHRRPGLLPPAGPAGRLGDQLEGPLRRAVVLRVQRKIRQKDTDLKGSMHAQGTTPRQLTDLIGSLCDLTSGSGDKGTPVVLVQGYFDNYTNS